jgi:hypothetical protein
MDMVLIGGAVPWILSGKLNSPNVPPSGMSFGMDSLGPNTPVAEGDKTNRNNFKFKLLLQCNFTPGPKRKFSSKPFDYSGGRGRRSTAIKLTNSNASGNG